MLVAQQKEYGEVGCGRKENCVVNARMHLPALSHIEGHGHAIMERRASKQAALTMALGITTRRRGSTANVLAVLAAVFL